MAKLSFNARMKRSIASLSASYDKVNKRAHELAMEIANHAKEHGDCSMAQALVMGLPASMRREMLILWFATYTPIVVKNSDDHNAAMHKPGSKNYVEWNLEDGDADPFYEMANRNKERPPMTTDDLIALIERLGGRLSKDIENGKVDENAIPTAQFLVQRLGEIKVPANLTDADNTDETTEEAKAA